MITKKINKFLSERLGVAVVRQLPRHSTRFAKDYFKSNSIKAIEIGSYEGFNAKSILKTLNVNELYIIDPYEEYQDYLDSEKIQTQSKLSKIKIAARKRLSNYNCKIKWIKDYSDNAISKITSKVNFIYIDGNHEYKYVKKDLQNYWDLLEDGGIMAGHDICSFPGVAKALFEFCEEKRLVPLITITDFILIKKEDVSEVEPVVGSKE